MARVRSRDTDIEREFRSALWRRGLRYRLHAKTPAGRPDLVFVGRCCAVFIDGCFWHGCPLHYSRPRTRPEFWAQKLRANVERDRRQTIKLQELGWRVVRIWEHEIKSDLNGAVERVVRALQDQEPAERIDWRVIEVRSLGQSDAEPEEERLLQDLCDPRHSQTQKCRRITGRLNA